MRVNGVEKQVRPSGWKPWANTIAYYPLTSTTTVNDMSGNNRNLTNGWVSFWVYQWVDCAYMSSDVFLYNNSNYWLSWNFTANIWSFFTVSWSEYRQPRFLWNNSWNIWIWYYESYKIWYNPKATETNTTPPSWWALLTVSYDGVNSKLYVNWNNVDTTAKSWYTYAWWPLWIGRYVTWEAANNRRWWLSEFILENKARTDQEVADYYNQTKWDYWIS